MRPVLRAATVAAALAVSYGVVASTPATATGPAGDTAGPAAQGAKSVETTRVDGTLRSRPDRVMSVLADRAAARPTGDTPTGTKPADTTDRRPATETTTAPAVAKAAPYDINGDGYRDVVVGSPGENLGSDTDAGMFHVLYSNAAGVTGAGSVAITQDTPGVPGSPEDGDQLGWTNTSGDFNTDGYADVAVAANAEDLGSAVYAGMVLVFYGSATGLRTDNVLSLEVARTELYFGDALAAGDFNGDGWDDLAAGGPWHDGGPGYDSGSTFVFYGGSTGLSTSYQEYYQGNNVPGIPGLYDGFGWTLSAGDVNGDSSSDLVIGAVSDWEDLGWSTGSVTVLYGNPAGLNANHDGQRFSKETYGVPGSGGHFDIGAGDWPDDFGFQAALADFTGDGKADLAVGAPGSPVYVDGVRKRDAGTFTVLYSDGAQISITGAVQVTQQTAGMPGTAGYEDYLGSALAPGDADGDGAVELAAYSPGDTYVTVVPGGSGGLVYTSAKGWTQNSSGIPGTSESGDYWGSSLRFEDIKNVGRASLIVGANGENNFRGAFTVIHSTSTGLTGTGAQAFSQDSSGVPGTAEVNDAFGTFY